MANQGGATGPQQPEERRRRRAIAWWWWAVGGLVVVAGIAAVVVLGGGDDSTGDTPSDATAPAAAATSSATTSAPAASTSDATQPAPAATSDSGGGTDSAGAPDIEGVWEFIVDVTETSGVCAGEENQPPSIGNVTVRRVGDNSYSITGFGTTPDDAWTGRWDGDDFVFSGEREEDGGLTKATFTVRLVDGSVTGTEDWSWSGSDGTCPTGKSNVEAYFYAPLN